MIESKLFSEMQIGSMKLKNRTFMAPMSLGYESKDGTINDTMEEYWVARAKGGVGCIIVDALSVDPAVPYLGNTLCFSGEESIKAYTKFTNRIHQCGAKVIPQITHPGPESISAFYGVPPIASSTYLNSMGQKTRELAIEELPGIIEKYVQGAFQAKCAGFDGIELHCAHAYMLLGSFLSPMRNKRTDSYGGCLDNRARLLFEVIDGIKAKCGKEFPIILRISGSERDEQGNTVQDMKYLVPKLIAHGIDALEVSGGTQYERCNKIIPCHGERRGINVEEAAEIKQISTIPVIVVGKINEPEYAAYLVDSGAVDGVVLGRALLADEEFVKKAEENRIEEIAPCASCGIGCIGEQTKRKPASCVINPTLGREKEFLPREAKQKKNVVIVGGGIGGMASARAFAMCGHKVTVLEKEKKLGGQMRVACIPPYKQEMSRWLIYLEQELERCQVNVQCGITVTKEILDSYEPEVVVIATGAKEFVPPIPGVNQEEAITAQMVLKNERMITGGNILVVGGGMVGCEVCQQLIHQKRGPLQLTMIEMLPSIGSGMVPNNLQPMMQHLESFPVKMFTGTKLLSVNGTEVEVEEQGERKRLTGFDQIIFACGSHGEVELYQQIKENYEKTICIGDANGPRQALEAVREGVEAAYSLFS
ncbi:MAG: FAD-dependent oxidoreductase [Lachnospiraceae bacterium]